MEREELLELLPFGREALLLREVIHKGNSVVATAWLEPIKGHFKDRVITPGTQLLEASGQAGVALLMLAKAHEEKRIVLYKTSASFFNPVDPPALVTINALIVEKVSNKIRVSTSVETTKKVSEATIIFALVDWK